MNNQSVWAVIEPYSCQLCRSQNCCVRLWTTHIPSLTADHHAYGPYNVSVELLLRQNLSKGRVLANIIYLEFKAYRKFDKNALLTSLHNCRYAFSILVLCDPILLPKNLFQFTENLLFHLVFFSNLALLFHKIEQWDR